MVVVVIVPVPSNWYQLATGTLWKDGHSKNSTLIIGHILEVFILRVIRINHWLLVIKSDAVIIVGGSC